MPQVDRRLMVMALNVNVINRDYQGVDLFVKQRLG
jgi:hypothetical protein